MMNYLIALHLMNITFCTNSFHLSVLTVDTHSDHEDMNSCLTSKSRLDELNFIHRMLKRNMYVQHVC